jgi:hypothetical protein
VTELNLQFFAEEDIHKQSSKSLKKAIRNLTKRIKEHEEYITNPYSHVTNWDEYSILYREGLKKHWRKEIVNFNNSIKCRIEELRKRGDNYE